MKDYLTAFTSKTPAGFDEMISLATPGSPADQYAQFQQAAAASLRAAGNVPDADDITDSGDGSYKLCQGTDCSTFSAFQTTDGKVTSFTVDDKEIGSRLLPPGAGPVTEDGITVELVGAYQSAQSDALFVALRFNNGSGETQNPLADSAEYVGPDGNQVQAAAAYATSTVRDGATSLLTVIFQDVQVGGTVYLSTYAEGQGTSDLAIPVKRP